MYRYCLLRVSIKQSKQYTKDSISLQVALMRYYSDVYPEFGYDEHQSKEALLKV